MAKRQAAGNGAIGASKPLRKPMRNRLKLVAVIASICSSVLVCHTTFAADQPAGPTVSRSVAKQLKAAQDAVVQKHFDEALGKINEAKAVSGEKTAYDNYVIDVILIQIYQGKNDIAD